MTNPTIRYWFRRNKSIITLPLANRLKQEPIIPSEISTTIRRTKGLPGRRDPTTGNPPRSGCAGRCRAASGRTAPSRRHRQARASPSAVRPLRHRSPQPPPPPPAAPADPPAPHHRLPIRKSSFPTTNNSSRILAARGASSVLLPFQDEQIRGGRKMGETNQRIEGRAGREWVALRVVSWTGDARNGKSDFV